jgi:IPT/TIG domain
VISGFSPGSGPPGTKVTIKGSLLTGTTSVDFNGAPAASFTVKSDKQLVAVVAAGTTTGTIMIDGPHGITTSSAPFVVPPLPTVTSFLPASGPVGTKITITGTGFKAGGPTVTINGVKASADVKSDTTIVAKVNQGTTSGQIAVTTKNGTGISAATFTVT